HHRRGRDRAQREHGAPARHEGACACRVRFGRRGAIGIAAAHGNSGTRGHFNKGKAGADRAGGPRPVPLRDGGMVAAFGAFRTGVAAALAIVGAALAVWAAAPPAAAALALVDGVATIALIPRGEVVQPPAPPEEEPAPGPLPGVAELLRAVDEPL